MGTRESICPCHHSTMIDEIRLLHHHSSSEVQQILFHTDWGYHHSQLNVIHHLSHGLLSSRSPDKYLRAWPQNRRRMTKGKKGKGLHHWRVLHLFIQYTGVPIKMKTIAVLTVLPLVTGKFLDHAAVGLRMSSFIKRSFLNSYSWLLCKRVFSILLLQASSSHLSTLLLGK